MESLFSDAEIWLVQLSQPPSWAQFVLLAVAAGAAHVIDRRIVRRFSGPGENRLRRLTQRAAERILFPVVTLLGILVGRALLRAFDMPEQIPNIAIPMLLSLAGVRLAVLVMRKSFAPSGRLKSWESLIATTAWSIVALHLLGWLPALLSSLDALALQWGTTRISLLATIKTVLMLGVMVTLSLWIARAAEGRLRKSTEISPALRITLAKFLRSFLVGIALLIGLNAVGIDLTAIAVFGGALGVGLGFGLQRIASNFLCGFILLLERSIKPGDVIRVGDSVGQVEALHARYVVIRNGDGAETLIPNESLITSEVVNWTYTDRLVRVRIPVQIGYDADPAQVMELMNQVASASNRVLRDPGPACHFMEFGLNGVVLELRVWIEDPEVGDTVKTELNLALWQAFNNEGITFDPRSEIHVRELPEALERT